MVKPVPLLALLSIIAIILAFLVAAISVDISKALNWYRNRYLWMTVNIVSILSYKLNVVFSYSCNYWHCLVCKSYQKYMENVLRLTFLVTNQNYRMLVDFFFNGLPIVENTLYCNSTTLLFRMIFSFPQNLPISLIFQTTSLLFIFIVFSFLHTHLFFIFIFLSSSISSLFRLFLVLE